MRPGGHCRVPGRSLAASPPTIVAVEGDKVRLGTSAPPSVTVDRRKCTSDEMKLGQLPACSDVILFSCKSAMAEWYSFCEYHPIVVPAPIRCPTQTGER